jgi:hypothetical protein
MRMCKEGGDVERGDLVPYSAQRGFVFGPETGLESGLCHRILDGTVEMCPSILLGRLGEGTGGGAEMHESPGDNPGKEMRGSAKHQPAEAMTS